MVQGAGSTEWFYAAGNNRRGPVTERTLIDKIKSGELGRTSKLWKDGFPKWVVLENTGFVQCLPHASPPSLDQVDTGGPGEEGELGLPPIPRIKDPQESLSGDDGSDEYQGSGRVACESPSPSPPSLPPAQMTVPSPVAPKKRSAAKIMAASLALFFITLIVPIQFNREWITIGWALEGAALLWLFHRVPHPGLRLTGVGLLVAAFVRLALNPAVLEYHVRVATPVLNWYLYAYGIVTVALFAGAGLLAPPRNLILEANVQLILAGLGTVLAFLLLNIEIADYFSALGSTMTFQISGNDARDMTYSIGWALFALGVLVVGIMRRLPAARYAAIGLLCVTLLKLFLHDLAHLGPLYRIGAFVSVAVIAMLALFAYFRFLSTEKEQNGRDHEKHEDDPEATKQRASPAASASAIRPVLIGWSPAPRNMPTSLPNVNILFYYKVNDAEKGPNTLKQLTSMWDNGQITADALHRTSDSTEWLPLLKRFSEPHPVSQLSSDSELAEKAQTDASAVQPATSPQSPLPTQTASSDAQTAPPLAQEALSPQDATNHHDRGGGGNSTEQ